MSGKVGGDGPGTPSGRLKELGDYAVAKGLCTGFEAQPPETFIINALEAALSASPQDGWVLVPREPTEYMLLKAETAYAVPWVRPMSNAYKALIDAAPALPQPTGDGT
jgi:hypothetical protein